MTEAQRIEVAAGILLDPSGRVLLTERLGDSPFAGLWEFPGGKIHDNESASAAMERELAEELGITVLAAQPFMNVQHDYADRRVALQFFLVGTWDGNPAGLDGQALSWRHPADITATEILPADGPVLQELQKRVADLQGVTTA